MLLPFVEQSGFAEDAEQSPMSADERNEEDSVDVEVEELMMEELSFLADSMSVVSVQAQPVVAQTDFDRRLLDWALEWLPIRDDNPYFSEKEIDAPDSVVAQQLYWLPTTIEMTYNSVVRRYIDMYLKNRQRQLGALLRLGDYYFPLFDDKLCEWQLPYELKYLPVIESALNAQARSHAGAAGLWQFMPSTARIYGLEVNSLVDERLDPYKSTEAACKFLKSLYALYGDWHLVLAAYNCGPGNVNKAIRRSGGKRDFWSIYPWLPRETRSYVPLFIAAVYSMSYAPEYGIAAEPFAEGGTIMYRNNILALCADTIHTDKRQHLLQTAEVLGVNMAELRSMNPAYMKDVIPGGKDYILALPLNFAGGYVQYEDSIIAYKADSLIHSQKANIDMAQKIMYDGTYSSGGVTYYKVKKGDTLGAIARRFHCSVKQLQKWNGLKNTNLQINQRLKILK